MPSLCHRKDFPSTSPWGRELVSFQHPSLCRNARLVPVSTTIGFLLHQDHQLRCRTSLLFLIYLCNHSLLFSVCYRDIPRQSSLWSPSTLGQGSNLDQHWATHLTSYCLPLNMNALFGSTASKYRPKSIGSLLCIPNLIQDLGMMKQITSLYWAA